jgi:hypothetical protein
MLEDVADLLGVEPRVDRDQHRAGERDAEVGLEEGGHVRREERDAIAVADSRLAERGREPARAKADLAVGDGPGAVDGAEALLVDPLGALEEEKGAELGTIDAHAVRCINRSRVATSVARSIAVQAIATAPSTTAWSATGVAQ